MQFLRIGTGGLRGKIGAGLNPLIAIDFVSAFATYMDGGRIIVARDSRLSSPMLYHATVSALLSCGADILDAGICPAPLLQYLVPKMEASGAILVGAGHHPPGWNAIVAIGRDGAYLNSIRTQELLDVYHNRRYALKNWDRIGKIEQLSKTLEDEYVDMLLGLVDADMIRKAKFRIVADFCNGSGSPVGAKISERLGIRIASINDSFSGLLPHDPEPRPRSSVHVKSIMRYLEADAGFVFNSDMSRLAIVTDDLETLSEEYSYPIAMLKMLHKSEKGQTFVTNVCSTRTIDELVARHGHNLLKTKVGQSYTIDKMRESKAVAAGDGSGSVAVADGVAGYDSFAGMLLVLEAMALQKARLSEIMRSIPRHHIIKNKINCPSSHAYTLVRKMKPFFADARVSEEDGFRFDWKDGWIHLRAAMTEPIIRVIVEWRTKEEAEEKADEIRALLERLVTS